MSEVGKYPRQQRQKDYMDGHQRKAKKIYMLCYTERRTGTCHIDRKDSRQESERKIEANDVIIHGRR